MYVCTYYSHIYIHLYLYFHLRLIPEGVAEASQIRALSYYQNDLATWNTADVTGGKPIDVWLQSISGGDAVNPLVPFYDIYGRKREVPFFCPVLFCLLFVVLLFLFVNFSRYRKISNTFHYNLSMQWSLSNALIFEFQMSFDSRFDSPYLCVYAPRIGTQLTTTASRPMQHINVLWYHNSRKI
jgi:hypothetical protein